MPANLVECLIKQKQGGVALTEKALHLLENSTENIGLSPADYDNIITTDELIPFVKSRVKELVDKFAVNNISNYIIVKIICLKAMIMKCLTLCLMLF